MDPGMGKRAISIWRERGEEEHIYMIFYFSESLCSGIIFPLFLLFNLNGESVKCSHNNDSELTALFWYHLPLFIL